MYMFKSLIEGLLEGIKAMAKMTMTCDLHAETTISDQQVKMDAKFSYVHGKYLITMVDETTKLVTTFDITKLLDTLQVILPAVLVLTKPEDLVSFSQEEIDLETGKPKVYPWDIKEEQVKE